MKITDSKHRLLELLRNTGDTQNEMARKSGLTKSAISNYLNGTREPRQDAIYKLSEAYDVSPSWLMGLSSPKRDEEMIRSKLVKLRLEYLEIDEDDVEKLRLFENRMRHYEELLKEAVAAKSDNKRMETNEKNEKALELYELYQKAPDNIKDAINNLLRQ